jgi:hypothetical protein
MRVRPFLIASAFILCAHTASAQGLSHYRDYTLASSVASVLKLSGGGPSDVKTTRERPATMREVAWHARYVLASASAGADPVHDILFSFYNDQLYRVAVTYERDRIEGLTSADVIAAISKTYGLAAQMPPAVRGGTAPEDPPVVARWEDADAVLTLTRDTYSGQFQVVLISKVLNDSARAVLTEAARLDAQEAPQRALDLRKQEAASAEQTRGANQAGFRP